MKKLFAILLALAMLLSLCACATRGTGGAETQAPETEAETTVPATEKPTEAPETEPAPEAEPADDEKARSEEETDAAATDGPEETPETEEPATEPAETEPTADTVAAFIAGMPRMTGYRLTIDITEASDGISEAITGIADLQWNLGRHAFAMHANLVLDDITENGWAYYMNGTGYAVSVSAAGEPVIEDFSEEKETVEKVFEVIEKIDFDNPTPESIRDAIASVFGDEIPGLDDMLAAEGIDEETLAVLQSAGEDLKEALFSDEMLERGWRFKQDGTELGRVYSIEPDLMVLIETALDALLPAVARMYADQEGVSEEEMRSELEDEKGEFLSELSEELGDCTCYGELGVRDDGSYSLFFKLHQESGPDSEYLLAVNLLAEPLEEGAPVMFETAELIP